MNFIVTGAGGGIGFQTALALAEIPDARVVCISRNWSNLDKLMAESLKRKLFDRIFIYPMDLTDYDTQAFLDFLRSNHILSIEGLVNNAGLLINKPFEELTDQDYKSIYEVNVFAPVRLIREMLPLLKMHGSSHIVNISSLGGFQGSSKFKGLSAYSSSKAAIACLTECLATEFTGFNISVNALALGTVDTEMLQQAFPGFNAKTKAHDMGKYIADFTVNGHRLFNGKIIPVSLAAQ